MRTSFQTATSAGPNSTDGGAASCFLLHFQSFFHAGREFAFPCDEHGQVNLDEMSAPIRNNYLYARAMLGREFAWPNVRCVDSDHCRPVDPVS